MTFIYRSCQPALKGIRKVLGAVKANHERVFGVAEDFKSDSKNESTSFLQAFTQKKEKGIALMMALMVTIVVMMYAGDMIVTSAVSLERAVANSDQVKAEFVAKSGMNLTVFMVLADWGIDLKLKDQLKQPITDGPEDFYNFLVGLPIGGDMVEAMAGSEEGLGLNKVIDAKAIEEIKGLGGAFVLDVQDESSKINVNFARTNRTSKYVRALLPALFSCPAEQLFLEKKNLTPDEVVYRIIDFVDKNETVEEKSGFSDENEPYLEQNPPYKAKNLPFNSLSELKLVAGWDDQMHKVFAPYLTTYPAPKEGSDFSDSRLNINYLPKEFLACLFPAVQQECREKFYKEFEKAKEEGKNFAAEGGIKEALSTLACYDGADQDKDAMKMDELFTSYSSTFRLSVTGTVNDQEKKLEVVIRKRDPSELKAKNNKDSRAFELLYWKLKAAI